MPDPATTLPPVQPPDPANISGGPVDDLKNQAAIDAVMRAQAAAVAADLITAMQVQIDQLTTQVSTQADDIARLIAVTGLHACPANVSAPTAREAADHPLNIEECVKGGFCNCEAGYILTSNTWQPPTDTASPS